MEVLDELNSSEKILALRAAVLHVPLGGTFELLPVCNMDCKMCYIRTTPENMRKQGKMLTADEWIKIAEDARDQGMLYLLLTGGEPLLYPEFEKLYTWLGTSGIVVVLNTNGTMIDEHIADLLCKYPPRKVNISLYGASDETYKRLCNYPSGFTKVIRGIQLLQKRNIKVKLNSSITPFNYSDLSDMQRIAGELGIPLQITPYMFPPIRKNGIATEKFIRFTPKEAANIIFANAKETLSKSDYYDWIKSKYQSYEDYRDKKCSMEACGISCYGSKNNFWINWKGEMLPCGMMNRLNHDIIEEGFSRCWEQIGMDGKQISNPSKCCTCEKRSLCMICSAASLSETESFDETPDYLCEMTDCILQILEKEVTKNEIKE